MYGMGLLPNTQITKTHYV